MTYVLAFWLAAVALFIVIRTMISTVKSAAEKRHNPWLWIGPGGLIGGGFALFIGFIFRLLPALLDVPNQLRGRGADNATFRGLMGMPGRKVRFNSSSGRQILLSLVGILWTSWIERNPTLRVCGRQLCRCLYERDYLADWRRLTWLTWTEVQAAYVDALEAGEGLDLWTQIITISAGFLLLILAWWLWDSAEGFQSDPGNGGPAGWCRGVDGWRLGCSSVNCPV
ncbi:MAG: hypothetical protein R2867_21935 [Caldilineaceae bacterium]